MLAPDLREKLRHNAAVNIADGSLFGFGIMGLASYVTIVPLFLSYLTESTALIGFVATLFYMGWQVPQLFVSNYVAGLRRYKPMTLAMTLLERLPYFGLALVAFAIPTIGTDAALALTLLLLGIQSLGGGFTGTAWQSLMSKIMPPHRLGTFFGIQSACVNLFGAGGALLAALILERMAFPEGFSLLFFIAGISLMLSFVFLALTYEPASESKDVVERANWREFGSRLGEILRENDNFRWFLIARALTSLSLTAVSFYTIYGIRRFDMSPEMAGALTSVLLVSNTLTSTAVGWAGDRWGHRRILIGANLLTVAAIITLLLAPDATWLTVVFALTGAVNATQWSTMMTLTVQFGSVAERPFYIGMANTLIAPVTIFAPIIGGWLVDAVSFELAFAIFAAAGLLSLLVFVLPMREPPGAIRATPKAAIAD
ncbi:MAG: MFS transporter [Chloroflexi bacterium]|nr:MFS transporter [Chloroflexota bacterium]MCY3583496.1 MFS transporter [Chloroflexota bacterium]MCY3715456.1 MFS transporter [Chloroflexota bacterium]MDE2651152.1 MFS transporter [Chloroflexota bacterium]MXV92232.1 MFS transporter [Chloroflexota bacterium]